MHGQQICVRNLVAISGDPDIVHVEEVKIHNPKIQRNFKRNKPRLVKGIEREDK
ncbi:hypothetical protein DNHGIG_10290 [Collibacillus ludicampi]|uniref:Uncharacterized protein n=1 Tax=Collibacillus ludicampi TaxID=2771369 RepID=A0AAV4LCJ2_9BACL|nr:hypothetical protein DNHGIG_10290 [Collibacillus ludicampi]